MKDSDSTKNSLDDVVDAIKSDVPSEQHIQAAFERVRACLQQDQGADSQHAEDKTPLNRELNSVEQYIAAIPDYLAGRLPAAQKLLFEEESRHSLQLRRELKLAREQLRVNTSAQPSLDTIIKQQRPHYMRWFSSAAATFVVVVSALWMYSIMPSLNQSQLFQVQSINGNLYRVADGRLQALNPGDWVSGQMNVRTGSRSTAALRLDDESVIELNHRTELSVTRRYAGNQINVDRGQIIVAASPQGSGHLDVATNEFVVSVKGTIFQVAHGAMGSNVSVIEGLVQVDQDGDTTALEPGQELGSRSGLSSTNPFEAFSENFSWSVNADEYLAIMSELDQLQEQIDLALAAEDRFDTRLLQLMPAKTIGYMAVPNAPQKISDIYQTIRTQMTQSQRLSEYWDKVQGESHELDEVMAWMDELGSHLGQETVLGLVLQINDIGNGEVQGSNVKVQPVILSEVDASFRGSFEQLLQELENRFVNAESQHETGMAIIDDPAQAQDNRLNFWIHGDLLIGSVSAATMQEMAAVVMNGDSAFVNSDFYSLLFNQYSGGAQFLGALDLKTLIADYRMFPSDAAQELSIASIDDVNYIVANRKQDGRNVTTTAELIFGGPRHGVMSMLSAPAPMGSLDFFSTDSTIVNVMLFESPAFLLDEVEQQILQAGELNEHREKTLEALYTVRDEVIPSIGGEVALGLDGPALPTPAWKIVLEMQDEVLFQSHVEQTLAKINDLITQSDHSGRFEIVPEAANNYSGYRVEFPPLPQELQQGQIFIPESINYAYVDGYLVVAPNISMLRRAITQYHSGVSLLMDGEFQRVLPDSGDLNFSAITFSRIQRLIYSLASNINYSKITDEQRQLLEQNRYNGASFYGLTGTDNSIRFYNEGGSFIGANLSSVLALYGTFGVNLPIQNNAQTDVVPAPPAPPAPMQ